MSKALRNSLIVIAVVAGAAALLLVGMYFGRTWWSPMGYWSGNMMAPAGSLDDSQQFYDRSGAYGYMGPGMMGQGMMGSGMMGGGMMGYFQANPLLGIEPLSVEEAEQAVSDYLEALEDENLELGEIMVFDNHAYAQIIEANTGRGAMEVLIDPVTGAVYPEFGPNMMWNLKYSPMGAGGMMGMMSGVDGVGQGFGMGGMMGSTADEVSEEMPISEEEAIEIAQDYLEAYVAGAEAAEHADPFYGYYTIHIEREGEAVGMLSVNGYTRAVWLHSWHGELVETSNH